MADETKPTHNIKDDLALLEYNINKLKVEYEQYFMRVRKREPLTLRGQVDKTVAFYTSQYIQNTFDKFKFRNLADKYSSFKQYWTRTLKMIEEGTYKRRAEDSGAANMTMPPMPKFSKRPEPKAAAPKPKKKTDEPLKELYDTYIKEMKKINEPTDNITFDFMKKAVGAQKKKAEEKYGTKELNFKIKSAGGKVKIQIIPKK
jgi:hypothetical protein